MRAISRNQILFHLRSNFRCPVPQLNNAYPSSIFAQSHTTTGPDRIPTTLGDSSARVWFWSHWTTQIRNVTPQYNTHTTRWESRPRIHGAESLGRSVNYVDLLDTSTISRLMREISCCLKKMLLAQLGTQRGQTTLRNRSLSKYTL